MLSRRSWLAGAAVLTGAHASDAAAPPGLYSSAGQYTQLRPVRPAPTRPIATAGGSLVDFSALLGRVALVNFWATWCRPCVAEMPSLDRLQATYGAQVVPISMDQGGKPAIEAFYERLGLSHLAVIADPAQQIGYFNTDNPGHGFFPLYALPITYVIDPKGLVVGYVPGAAKWDTLPALTLIHFLRDA